MVDLEAILESLNKDPNESKKFQADPVGYLEAKGLHLPDEAKKQLVANVKAHPGANAGWSAAVVCGPKT